MNRTDSEGDVALSPESQLLIQALSEYCAALDAGRSLHPESFLKRYADVSEELESCLEGLSLLRRAVQETGDTSRSKLLRFSDSRLLAELGGYRIGREIGRGGMGVVYQADEVLLGRRVAIKILPQASALSSQQLARFKNEARAAATLDHPNIVSVYAVRCDHGIHYYAMQYVDGISLAERIKQLRIAAGEGTELGYSSIDQHTVTSVSVDTSPANVNRREHEPSESREVPSLRNLDTCHAISFCTSVASAFRQAAEALRHAHERGIVHRDIKPANLLLDSAGDLFVTDFGLARIESDPTMTTTGDVLGTLKYMSPEQRAGDRTVVDHRTDIYSLGVTMYELLTLKPVYPDADRYRFDVRVWMRDPKPPRELNRFVPRDLENIVLKAMSPDREQRYATAGDLSDDLLRFLEHRPVLARPLAWPQRWLRWVRRHAEWAVAAMVLFAVISSVIAVAALRVRSAARETEVALVDARSQRRAASLEATKLALDRGLSLCAEGHVADGLLWLAHSLESCPPDATAIEGVIRANLSAWADQLHPLRHVFPHPGDVHRVRLLPDGTLITACADGTIRRWTLDTGAVQLNPFSPSPSVRQRDFLISPDHQTALTLEAEGPIRRWDVASARQIGDPIGRSFQAYLSANHLWPVAFSSDSQAFASWTPEGVAEWPSRDGSEPLAFYRTDEGVQTIVYTPDGKSLVTGRLAGYIDIWNRRDQQRTNEPTLFRSPDSGITSLAVDPTGQLLAVGTSDHVLTLCELPELRQVVERRKHFHDVANVTYSPSGRLLASASTDGTVRLWQGPGAMPYGAPIELNGWALSVNFSSDGERFAVGEACGADTAVRVFEVAKPAFFFTSLADGRSIITSSLSADGQDLYVADEHGVIHELRTSSGEPTGRTFRGQRATNYLRISVADGALAMTEDFVRLTVWNTHTGKRLFHRGDLRSSIEVPTFTADGSMVVIPDGDGKLKFIDLRSQQVQQELEWNGMGRYIGQFDADGRFLLTIDQQPNLALWDVRDGARRVAELPHAIAPESMAYDAERGWFVTSTFSGSISFFDGRTGAKARSTASLPRPFGEMLLAAGGQQALAFAGNGTAQLFDLETRLPIGPMLPHSRAIHAGAIAADGQTVMTVDDRGAACIWQVPPPVTATSTDVMVWVETVTGRRLDRDGIAHSLTAQDWALSRGLSAKMLAD